MGSQQSGKDNLVRETKANGPNKSEVGHNLKTWIKMYRIAEEDMDMEERSGPTMRT